MAANEAPEAMGEAAAPGGGGGERMMTMVVGVDESEPSAYTLQWTLQHFFPAHQPPQYRLVVVTAKHASAPAVGPAGPGAYSLLRLRAVARLGTVVGFVTGRFISSLCATRRRWRARDVRGRGRVQGEGGGRRPRRRPRPGALRAGAARRRRVRGGRRGRAQRAVRGRRQARRRPARRRQPRPRRHQKALFIISHRSQPLRVRVLHSRPSYIIDLI
jgi:hypothetical protein